MITKQDLTNALKSTEERLTVKIEASRKEFKEEIGASKKEFKEGLEASRKDLHEEIENAVAQIAQATVKALENVATKDDLKEVECRLDKKIESGIEEVKTEVMYIKNDVRDLKADSPTAREFADHEKRISRLEKTAFPSN